MKRQPESTTEDLENAGDQGDADDDDMNAIGAVCEEPVVTIGVDGEKWDECENDEESHVDDVNGGFLDPEMVREARVQSFSWIPQDAGVLSRPFLNVVLTKLSRRDESTQIKGTNGLQKFVASWWRSRRRNATTQGRENALLRIHSTS